MLLLHQTGSVKIGEVVRYTVTYTPAHDRILPAPSQLYLRIKNTSAIALRAAFVHGPYTLYVAAYPASFSPNAKFENPRRDGVPEFEPNLKAGGSFSTELFVPEEVRRTAGEADRHGREGEDKQRSVTWIIEVSSQVIFSNSAAVHYEILLGRDEKSLSLGFGAAVMGGTAPVPGQVSDHQQSQGARDGHHSAQTKGVFSRAVRLRVDDTASLWNTPRLPEWDDKGTERVNESSKDAPVESVVSNEEESMGNRHRLKRQKKVHLVVLTHGLHSNLGADMLYLKESIDATARQAKIDARERRRKRKEEERGKGAGEGQNHDAQHGERRNEKGEKKHTAEQRENNVDEVEEEEEVIVRGFSGNAVRTERGIKYLGKRLAKYVLQMTFPDQPYRPISKRTATATISNALKPDVLKQEDPGIPTHNHSTIVKEPYTERKRAYKITSISFIAHSLGGLVQTYAVAYIQKHSPTFFDIIKPINFIALATPFLGLSNENPLYVKFALDFGLVGRTGQDLGLTWRAPTLARSGWGAIVGGISESAHKKIDGETAPESKPLLRILPTGPAHIVFKKFRNRTVYSNVVNDGIVPLRTSCLLFLDWQGLGRVEKARREIGLVGTMAGWGWAEITGQNSSSPMRKTFSDNGGSDVDDMGDNSPTKQGHGEDVPQPSPYATVDDDTRSLKSLTHNRPLSSDGNRGSNLASPMSPSISVTDGNPFASFFKLFQPSPSSKPSRPTKNSKIYKRSQTIRTDSDVSTPTTSTSPAPPQEERARGKATAGDPDTNDPTRLSAPPKTTFFEAAGDLLKPPLPSVEFLIDPSSRPRTIFHDRVYHPEDIPPPPLKKRTTSPLLRRRSSSTTTTITTNTTQIPSTTSSPLPSPHLPHASSSLSRADYDDTAHTNPTLSPHEVVDGSAMKVEEKIARAYHRDLSWRKVLVRLEPDAHNNMIVRRMFANAYGWPVIKHLCDTHFSDCVVAGRRDEDEGGEERAKEAGEKPGKGGSEVKDQHVRRLNSTARTASEAREAREARDKVPDLATAPKPGNLGRVLTGGLSSPTTARRPTFERLESGGWSDSHWADSGDESDDLDERGNVVTGEGRKEKEKEKDAAKGMAWNWTEVIAGKGAGGSLKGTGKGTANVDIEQFLGKKADGQGKADGRGENELTRVESGAAAVASRGLSGFGGALDGLKRDGAGEGK